MQQENIGQFPRSKIIIKKYILKNSGFWGLVRGQEENDELGSNSSNGKATHRLEGLASVPPFQTAFVPRKSAINFLYGI